MRGSERDQERAVLVERLQVDVTLAVVHDPLMIRRRAGLPVLRQTVLNDHLEEVHGAQVLRAVLVDLVVPHDEFVVQRGVGHLRLVAGDIEIHPSEFEDFGNTRDVERGLGFRGGGVSDLLVDVRLQLRMLVRVEDLEFRDGAGRDVVRRGRIGLQGSVLRPERVELSLDTRRRLIDSLDDRLRLRLRRRRGLSGRLRTAVIPTSGGGATGDHGENEHEGSEDDALEGGFLVVFHRIWGTY